MPAITQILAQAFPPKAEFTQDDIPDLSGQVIIVTGGNAGVGKETTRVLLEHNAKVYIASRSLDKAKKAIAELKEKTGKEAFFLKVDLSDLSSVKAAAAEYATKESRLDVLFNNAGVMTPPVDQLTAEGYDMQIGTNLIGPYYFTTLLLPVLLATAKLNPLGKARVINTSSGMHLLNNLDIYKYAKDSPQRKKVNAQKLYALSKYGVVMFTTELARRHATEGLVAISLHPGVIKTDLHRHITGLEGFAVGILERTVLHDVSLGAITQLYGGVSKQGAELNGKYLIPWARVGSPHPDTQDPKRGEELMCWLEEQVKAVK